MLIFTYKLDLDLHLLLDQDSQLVASYSGQIFEQVLLSDIIQHKNIGTERSPWKHCIDPHLALQDLTASVQINGIKQVSSCFSAADFILI